MKMGSPPRILVTKNQESRVGGRAGGGGGKDSFRRLQVKRELQEEHQAGQTDAVGFPPPGRDRPQSRVGGGNLNVCTKPPMSDPCRERGLEKKSTISSRSCKTACYLLGSSLYDIEVWVQIYRTYMI